MREKLVQLKDFLERSTVCVSIDPEKQYKQVTVRLWGQGVCLRDIVYGSEIGADRRTLVSENQFILSRIDARHAAFGLIPKTLDGAVVSSDFPVYDVNADIVLPDYLRWMSRSSQFLALCRSSSKGTTNRVRVEEKAFLNFTVSLPDIPEQRRVVELLDNIEGKLKQVTSLSANIADDSEFLCQSLLFGKSHPKQRLSEFLTLRQAKTIVDATQEYEFAGVYSFGKGVFRGNKKSGMEFAYKTLTEVHAADFVYPKLMAWEGALGVVPDDLQGLFVSPEFPVFSVNQSIILPLTLLFYFKKPEIWSELAALSSGTNARRRRLHPERFLSYEMPVPPMPLQLAASEVYRRTKELAGIDHSMRDLHKKLLPAIIEKVFRRTFRPTDSRDLVLTL